MEWGQGQQRDHGKNQVKVTNEKENMQFDLSTFLKAFSQMITCCLHELLHVNNEISSLSECFFYCFFVNIMICVL